VKDRIFTGPDVEEAIAVAAASLGLARGELRYVVLDRGSAGGRGLKPTPARIAVLVQEPPRDGERGIPPALAPTDLRVGLRATIRALAEAGGLDVEAEIQETEEAWVVRLRGADVAFFLEPEGRGEVFRATEHLLQRLYGASLRPQALRLSGEGFRERRDEALAEEARRLAEAVRRDGQPHTMDPLNAYERRVVHLALRDEPGVVTFSVGEGPGRRVKVAPAGAAGPGPEASDGGE
jgi:spoIIIJ-associated protein